jgi:hypothetical protein
MPIGLVSKSSCIPMRPFWPFTMVYGFALADADEFLVKRFPRNS